MLTEFNWFLSDRSKFWRTQHLHIALSTALCSSSDKLSSPILERYVWNPSFFISMPNIDLLQDITVGFVESIHNCLVLGYLILKQRSLRTNGERSVYQYTLTGLIMKYLQLLIGTTKTTNLGIVHIASAAVCTRRNDSARWKHEDTSHVVIVQPSLAGHCMTDCFYNLLEI